MGLVDTMPIQGCTVKQMIQLEDECWWLDRDEAA